LAARAFSKGLLAPDVLLLLLPLLRRCALLRCVHAPFPFYAVPPALR
jgi:hypothetical protein